MCSHEAAASSQTSKTSGERRDDVERDDSNKVIVLQCRRDREN